MGLRLNTVINVTTSQVLPAYANVVNVDTSMGNVDVTLPTPDGVNVENGTTIWINYASGGNLCSILPSAGITIDGITNYKILPQGQIKLVLIGSTWFVDYTNRPIAYYECNYIERLTSWTISSPTPYIAFHADHKNWTLDTITVSAAVLGGRGSSGFRLLKSGVPVLITAMAGTLLCETFTVNRRVNPCDIFTVIITSISSPPLIGASVTFKVVPYL